MRYLGMDVHAKWTVWCLLDAEGAIVSEGHIVLSFTVRSTQVSA